jgi:hypothetical protein
VSAWQAMKAVRLHSQVAHSSARQPEVFRRVGREHSREHRSSLRQERINRGRWDRGPEGLAARNQTSRSKVQIQILRLSFETTPSARASNGLSC